MIRRILAAAVLIPVVLGSIFYFPRPLFLIFMDVVLGLALWEFLAIVRRQGARPYLLTFPLVLALPWIWAYRPAWVLPYLIAVCLVVLTWCVLGTRDMKSGFPSAAGNVLALIYLGVPLSIPGLLQGDHPVEIVLILLTIWMTESAAYFVGKAWGRHKITPAISPGKSLEGYVAGLLAAVITVPVYAHYLLPSWPLYFSILTGVLLGLLGTIGDLFESVLKRGAGVKDSSNLIPGHGGLLDRIDSLLFAFPVYYVLSAAWLLS